MILFLKAWGVEVLADDVQVQRLKGRDRVVTASAIQIIQSRPN